MVLSYSKMNKFRSRLIYEDIDLLTSKLSLHDSVWKSIYSKNTRTDVTTLLIRNMEAPVFQK